MISFPPLRMKRFTVRLHELTIGDGITIAGLSPAFPQAEATAFLRAVSEKGGTAPDPLDWTVQERTFAICHYIAATAEDGPDFSVGDGHYSDYVDMTNFDDTPESVEAGTVAGDDYQIVQLTGRMAESIERLQGQFKDSNGADFPIRFHWIVGGMAAQMCRTGEPLPTFGAEQEAEYDAWLLKRMQVFGNFAESDFWALATAYMKEREALAHLFRIDFSDEGVVVMPNEGGAKAGLPPARFPARSCIAAPTLGLG